MNSEETWDNLKCYLNGSGFNILARINADEYDSIVPGKKRASSLLTEARSVILSGFAGNKFWPLFQSFLKENPEFSKNNKNLIDNYTRLKFEQLISVLQKDKGSSFKSVYPFGDSAYDLDFMTLGIMGGLGVPSLLGILLHPEYGTWMSLRGAILTDISFADYDRPFSEFNPCPPCEKPCIGSCPANTVTISGWDWESCMKFRLSSDVCSSSCASRKACPYGNEYRYSEQQIRYHHEFVLKSIRKYLNTEDLK